MVEGIEKAPWIVAKLESLHERSQKSNACICVSLVGALAGRNAGTGTHLSSLP